MFKTFCIDNELILKNVQFNSAINLYFSYYVRSKEFKKVLLQLLLITRIYVNLFLWNYFILHYTLFQTTLNNASRSDPLKYHLLYTLKDWINYYLTDTLINYIAEDRMMIMFMNINPTINFRKRDLTDVNHSLQHQFLDYRMAKIEYTKMVMLNNSH